MKKSKNPVPLDVFKEMFRFKNSLHQLSSYLKKKKKRSCKMLNIEIEHFFSRINLGAVQ